MTSPTAITVEWTLKRRKGAPAKPVAPDAACQARIPRLARLMALSFRFDSLIQQGVIRDYADLARLGRVSRARITQIMNLLNLSPTIQENILLNPRFAPSCASERSIRKITNLVFWADQLDTWNDLVKGKTR